MLTTARPERRLPPAAVYPEEAINAHRAFITRRRKLRPSEEYRSPADEEWEKFLGHFERRGVALGDCGRETEQCVSRVQAQPAQSRSTTVRNIGIHSGD